MHHVEKFTQLPVWCGHFKCTDDVNNTLYLQTLSFIRHYEKMINCVADEKTTSPWKEQKKHRREANR